MWRRHPSAAGFTHNYAAHRRDQQRILDRGETAARTACDRNETTKVLVLEFSTPLSVLRVYPDTLTVERVLSIEFINCAPALGPRGSRSRVCSRAVRGSAGRRPGPGRPCGRAAAGGRLSAASRASRSRGRRRPGESDRLPPPGRCGRAAGRDAAPEPRRAPALAYPADYPGLRRPFRTGPIAGSPPM